MMNCVYMKRIIYFLHCVLFSQSLLAYQTADRVLYSFESDEGGESDIRFEEKEKEEEFILEIVESSRDWLSSYINDVSHGVDGFMIDTFFGDDIINDDVSGSRAKISFYTRRELGQPVDYSYGISLKLVLPNTNERFSLLVQSTDDEEDGRENNPVETVEKSEYSTALRFMFKETDLWKVSFDNGVKWALPPNPFSRLRFRRLAYFDSFNTRFTQTFDWSANDGFGEDSRFEINRPLNIDRLIRFSGGAKYMVQNDYFELDYGLNLYHELNRKEILAYYLRASGEVYDNMSFNNYGVGVRFRRMVYQDWAFAEISPEIETANSNNYDITPVIMFRFEALIGK